MRVLQVVPDIGNESSGPSYSVPGACRGLQLAGADVELMALSPAPDKQFPFETRYCQLSWWSPRRLSFSAEMRGAIFDACKRCEIVHSNSLWKMPDVYPGLMVDRYRRLHGGTGPKYVCSPRGAIAHWTLNKNRLIKKVFGAFWQWPALRTADMFHATSVKEYEEIRCAGFGQPVALVPIGMDIPAVSKRAQTVPNNHTVHKIVFFGRLHAVKKVDDLILAWKKVECRLPDWEVEIAGPDFGSETELRNLVAMHRIPRVKFVGEITGGAKYAFLADADLYVLPSLSENFGITIAEALACGTPVIASKGCPWPGLVGHKCGWWVDNSPDAIAGAILEACGRMDLLMLREMGERGRKWIANDYSWDGVGKKMLAAYQWLAQGVECPDWVRRD